MLEAIKSKSMVGIMLLIIGVSYVSAMQTNTLEENHQNEIVMKEQ